MSKIDNLRVIEDKVNILTHVEYHNNSKIRSILSIAERLEYDVVFIVPHSRRDIRNILKIQENTDILILTKQFLTSKYCRHIDIHTYDVVSIIPDNRFYLNKVMRMFDVDIICVDISRNETIPTSSQLKIIKQEGKSIEIMLNLDELKNIKYLRRLEIFLKDCIRHNVTFFLSIPVRDIYDIKNPYDVYSLVEVLCDVDINLINDLRRRYLQFLSDIFYRKGIEIII